MPTTTHARAAALPQTAPGVAARVMADQVAAYVALLHGLDAADWSRATDCTGWDVRQVAAHVAGALEEGARPLVLVRHMLAARRRARTGSMVDALNDLQVADRAQVPGPRLAEEMQRLAPRAIRLRRMTPGVVRRRPVPGDDLPPGSTLGYLFDVVYARDVWMHRIDTARASGRPFVATRSDGEVVAQVVRDLDRSWRGPALVLELTGCGAGTWLIGEGVPLATARTDAVAYLRLLSGRRGAAVFEVSGQPEVQALLGAARVAF